MAFPPGGLTDPQLDAALEMLGRGSRRIVLPIEGRSMLPTLAAGQWVAIELGRKPLERGDLVFYRQRDYRVVHRVLGPAGPGDDGLRLKTRGDGRNDLDPPLDRERVLGRVLAVRDDEGAWRDLTGAGGRLYALAVALHARFWSAAGYGALIVDRALARLGLRLGLRPAVAAADRGLLRLAHRALFPRLHPRLYGDPLGSGP